MMHDDAAVLLGVVAGELGDLAAAQRLPMRFRWHGEGVGKGRPTSAAARFGNNGDTTGVLAPMRWWQLVTVVLLVGGLVGCDHATKNLAATRWRDTPAVVVPGLVALTYAENRDSAFSLLHPVLAERLRRPLLLALASLGSLAALGILVGRWRRSSYPEKLAAGLFLAGAVGNVTDRAWRGYVIDFVSIGPWPVFNVADVALCVAVGLLALAWRGEPPVAAK